MKTSILYFTTCFHGFGILRQVDPFVRMLHIFIVLTQFTYKQIFNFTHWVKEIQNMKYSSMQFFLRGCASSYVEEGPV